MTDADRAARVYRISLAWRPIVVRIVDAMESGTSLSAAAAAERMTPKIFHRTILEHEDLRTRFAAAEKAVRAARDRARRGPRAAAKANGLLSYETGTPCAAGHIARRSTASGQCLECHRLASTARYRKRRALLIEQRLGEVEPAFTD